jgi:hypothetical protein
MVEAADSTTPTWKFTQYAAFLMPFHSHVGSPQCASRPPRNIRAFQDNNGGTSSWSIRNIIDTSGI